MPLFRKRINAPEAAHLFVKDVIFDSKFTYQEFAIEANSYGIEIPDFDFGFDVLAMGNVVIAGLYAYQVFDRATADALLCEIHKIVFEMQGNIEITKSQSGIFYIVMNAYSVKEKAYISEPSKSNIPILPTILFIMRMILNEPDELEFDKKFSNNLAKLYLDLADMMQHTIMKWIEFKKKYKIAA